MKAHLFGGTIAAPGCKLQILSLSLYLSWFTLTETDAVSPSVGLESWSRDQCAVADRCTAANKWSDTRVKHQEEINVFNVQ